MHPTKHDQSANRSFINSPISLKAISVCSVPPTGKKVKPCGAPGYSFKMDSAPDMAHLVAIRTLSSRSTSRVPQVKRAGGSCFVGERKRGKVSGGGED